jgi:hypothetical protein
MPINFAVKLIATVALEAMQMGLQASKHTYGPRLSETSMTTADYGTPLPEFLGERRFAGQIVWSRDLEIVDHTSKAKGGGKQTNQSALWTGGVAFANVRGGPAVDKILKIWLDETLAYDATGTGPISYASSLGVDLKSVMRIYLGTEDQMPDPAYVDYCEERYGPDSAPAFRGTGMLVFDRMPLDNFGNRPPQISILAVTAADPAYPYQQVDSSTDVSGGGFAVTSGGWMARWDTNGSIAWIDAPTRTELAVSNPASGDGPGAGTVSNAALSKDGTAFYYGTTLFDGFNHLYETPPAGVTTMGPAIGDASHRDPGPCRVFDFSDGTRQIYGGVNWTLGGYYLGEALVTDSQAALDFCLDDNEIVWGLFEPSGSSSNFELRTLTGAAESFTVTGAARAGAGTAYFCYVAPQRHFYVLSDGHWYLIDRDTGAIKDSGTQSYTTRSEWNSGRLQQNPGTQTSFWSAMTEISLEDGSTIRTLTSSNWLVESLSDPAFEPVNNAIVSWNNTGGRHVTFRFVDRVSNAGTTLGAIVSKMCDTAGLVDRDTSLLTQPVQGYSWTRGDAKSQMEPLLDIHDVDACPHDFGVTFKPRGTAPSGTIVTADFAKNGENARYSTKEMQDTDLPKLLRVNFADTAFDQQTNNILAPLPADVVDSQQDVLIDLTTCADTAAGAQQKGDRYMRRQWNGKDSVELSLTAQSLALEPGDVTTLDLDGIQWNAKLEKQSFIGSRMDCTFRRDEAAIAVLNSTTTGPEMGARDPEVIAIPAPVRGFVIDAPYRQDSDEDVRPLLYSAAGAYAQLAFPGASIWEETGIGADAAFDQLFATISSGATWGTCSAALATVSSPWLWDRGNSLTVTLQSGMLTSVSEAAIDADPTLNLILIWNPATGTVEYINFTTATLNGDGTYTLSGFKRGRRGTEWACGEHTTGELWILPSSLDVDEMGTDDVGGTLAFKAQALGRSLDATPEIDVAPYTGATLKPYAPASIAWAYNGTDLTGTITRRTRIGGAWTGGASIPLSENSEAYQVDVYNGSTFKRTITVTGTNVFTYTAAMAAADGITLPTPPTVNVYQMSDAVGRGYALAA